MLLTVADYPAIRAALDTSLDADVLPDAVIALPIYHAAAEREVLARVPTVPTEEALEQQRLAAIYLCAARLALALPQIESETTPDNAAYRRKVVAPEALATTLQGYAAVILDVLAPPSPPPAPVSLISFALAGPGR